jgi:ATP-binding cassette subfamily C protein CydC
MNGATTNGLATVAGLWRRRLLWLAAGLAVSLAALLAGVGLMVGAGDLVAAGLAGLGVAVPVLLRTLGGARVVLRYLERLLTHDATFRVLADLRVWFFRGLARSAAGGLGFRRAGDVLGRLVNDIEALDGLFIRILVPLAGAALLLPVLAVTIGWNNWPLALPVCVLFAFAAFALPWLAARRSMEAGARLAPAAAGLRVAALDALTGLREVRAFAAEDRMLAAVQGKEAALLSAQHALTRRTGIAGALAFLCAQAALLCVLLDAGVHPQGAVAAAFLLVAAFELIGGLPRAGALAGHAVAAANRVVEAATAPAAVAEPERPMPLPPGSALRFEAVRFHWRDDHPDVFDGLTLDVPEGARIALLGPSGVGKSTLAALALKLAAPQSGRILLGGADIATLSSDEVRSRIGWLSQATHLFDDTIRANLLLSRPGADDAALWQALDAARIGDTVRALPDRLDTWVGEGGARFSGGQGRRLALARTLLSPARVLILDEPCAGLDAATERAFLSTLNEVAEGRSIVLIAHRLIGVERLDRIWRLASGKAVAAAA